MQHVVEPLELAGPLQREHVQRLLDDAQPRGISAGVGADGTYGLLANIEAALAEHDLLSDRYQRRGEGARFRFGSAQQVVRQPLGCLRPDARQSRERFDEPSDRLDEGCRHGRRLHARQAHAAGDCRHLRLAQFPGGPLGFADRGHDEILKHLDVCGIGGRRVYGDADDLQFAIDDGLDDAPSGRTFDVGGGQFLLNPDDLLLHLHRHPLQVPHAHVVSF